MYICLCNGLKDSQFAAAIEQGAVSVSQVYRRCGCQPQCGKCVDYVREQIRTSGRDLH